MKRYHIFPLLLFLIVAGCRSGSVQFTKQIDVFGVEVWATDGVSDAKVRHAAAVMAGYLDNDGDGSADNPLVLEAMVSRNATLFMAADESEQNKLNMSTLEARGDALQNLFAFETHPDGSAPGNFDATLEEVLHLITHVGYANVYPDVWGEKPGSAVADAMDIARGGQFTSIPSTYPEGAWYTYDDKTCDYSCMVTEYIYWSLSSLLGAQAARADEISNEWKLHTPQLLASQDGNVIALLKNPTYKFANKVPDGTYDAIDLSIRPISNR